MPSSRATLLLSLFTISCGGVVLGPDGGVDPLEEDAGTGGEADAGGTIADAGLDAGMSDAGLDAGMSDAGTMMDAGTPCPAGMICVDRFPFTNSNDTTTSPRSTFDRYSCAPGTDESGNEVISRGSAARRKRLTSTWAPRTGAFSRWASPVISRCRSDRGCARRNPCLPLPEE